MRISENEICEKALKEFGLDKQMIKCIEELSELQKELCKLSLGQGNLENLIEEIADVEIMIEQMKIGLKIGFPDLLEAKSKKLFRLNERLKCKKPKISERGFTEELKDDAKCRQCLYTVLTDKELAELGSDPCDTCRDLCNWRPKELNSDAPPKA